MILWHLTFVRAIYEHCQLLLKGIAASADLLIHVMTTLNPFIIFALFEFVQLQRDRIDNVGISLSLYLCNVL